jgi:hypothetical protein
MDMGDVVKNKGGQQVSENKNEQGTQNNRPWDMYRFNSQASLSIPEDFSAGYVCMTT